MITRKVQRPSWLTEPCPEWCEWADSHDEGDAPDDRWHGVMVGVVNRTLDAPLVSVRSSGNVYQPAFARIELAWHHRHREAQIELVASLDAAVEHTITLTLAEARTLAAAIARALALAEGEACPPSA